MKIDEWLWFDNQNKWVIEIKQEPLNYYTDMYEAWQTKQQLEIWREVKWNVWWWSKTLTFTRLASVGTWVQNFTWFWFTPTDYLIKAWRYWDVTSTWYTFLCMSEWQYSAPYRQRIRPNWVFNIELWIPTTAMVSVSYTNIPWWWLTSATHSSFLSDWIALNFTSSAEDIIIQITAIK